MTDAPTYTVTLVRNGGGDTGRITIELGPDHDLRALLGMLSFRTVQFGWLGGSAVGAEAVGREQRDD
jgi:hypothetical protein